MNDNHPSISPSDLKQKLTSIQSVSTSLETKRSEVENLLNFCLKSVDFTRAVKESEGILIFTTMFKTETDFDLKVKLTTFLLFLSLSGHGGTLTESLMNDINVSSLVNLFLEKDFSIFMQAFSGLKLLASISSSSSSSKPSISFNLPTATLFMESVTALIDPSSKMLSDTQRADVLLNFAQFVKMGVMVQADEEISKNPNSQPSKNFSLTFGKFLKVVESCHTNDFSLLDFVSAQVLQKVKEGELIKAGQLRGDLAIINGWIGGNKKYNLLYKAANDGFAASTYHSKCNDKGATLTIITSNEGYVFGGYVAISMSGSGWVVDNSKQSFLFSLKNPRNAPPAKFDLQNPSNTIYAHPTGNGPLFGSNCDICCSNNNNSTASYTNLGGSYANPTGVDGKTVFTGAYNFTARDIEVYQVM